MKKMLRMAAMVMAVFLVNTSAMAQGYSPLNFYNFAVARAGSGLSPFFTGIMSLTQSSNTSAATGAEWIYNPIYTLSNGFSAYFQFQMTPGSNAQGLAFVFQLTNSNLGNGGSGLGYDGLSNSMAVAFVQQPSAALGQPAYPFVSIQSGAGVGKTNSANISHSLGISSYNPALNLADGKIHTAVVSFGPSFPPTNLAVFLDGSTTPVAQAPFSNSQLLAMHTIGQFYFGFTSASLPGQPVDADVLDLGLLENTRPQITVTGPQSGLGVVGQPMVISIQASNGVPSLPATLSVFNLPSGAMALPPFPLSGVGPLTTTINWTPQSVGTNNIIFSTTINGITTNVTNTIVVLPAAASGTTNQAFDLSIPGVTTNLQVVGRPTLLSNGFRLTTNSAPSDSGAVWWKTQVPVLMGFDTHFQFQMGAGTNTEGLAFVIQNSSLFALGGAFGNLGFAPIDHSVAVELVPNPTASFGDPAYQFVSVQTLFASPNSANLFYSLGTSTSLQGYPPPVNLADGQVHSVEIVLSPTNSTVNSAGFYSRFLNIFVDGGYYSDGISPPYRPQCQILLPMSEFGPILSNGMAWIGLTSATGNIASNTDVHNWTFAPSVPPFISVSPAIPSAVLAGSTVTFTVTGTAQTNVSALLLPVSLPSGASMTPTLPLTINPGQSISSTFSWTAPVVAQPTTNRIALTAAMYGGLQSIVSGDIVVYPPPTLGGFQYTNGNFRFGFSSVSNLSLTVLTSTNLYSNWTVLPAFVTQTSPGQYQIVDTNTPAAVRRFYRIRSP